MHIRGYILGLSWDVFVFHYQKRQIVKAAANFFVENGQMKRVLVGHNLHVVMERDRQ